MLNSTFNIKEKFFQQYKDGKDIKQIISTLQIPSSTGYRWLKKIKSAGGTFPFRKPKPVLEAEDKKKWFIHNLSHKEKFNLITELIAEKEIKRLLLEENYSFGMIKDMLARDFIKNDTNEVVKHIVQHKQHQMFANILKSNKLYFDLEKYNKMPQHWKIQYRFPKEHTEEQIKQEIKKSSAEGQKKTVEKMKASGSYKGRQFHRSWSPLTTEFYTKKGWTEEEATKAIKEICANGAKKTLKNVSYVSGIEQKIKELLIEKNVSFSQQFYLKNDQNIDNRTRFFYDFYILEKNILIEVNGDFFHANPIFYSENDIVPLPENKMTAKDIWERDNRKFDFAKSKGYDVIYLWEYEINHQFEKIQERLKNAGIY